MFTETSYHIQVIRESLSSRQRSNPAYSLRAFARDTDLDASTLSQVLKGKRPLPLKNCAFLVKALRLSPTEKTKFMESAFRKRALLEQIQVPDAAIQDRFIIDESYYRVIAEWEHYGVLTALEMDDFELRSENAVETICDHFELAPLRAEAVLQNLLNAGLIRDVDGRFAPAHGSVHTTDEIASDALRASHTETLEIGKQKLDAIELALRDFSSLNFAFDFGQMTELKAIVREFRQKVTALAKTGKNRTQVYQLAIQAYPLSSMKKQKPKSPASRRRKSNRKEGPNL